MKHTILIVEDEKELREMMCEALELHGVVVLALGEAALFASPAVLAWAGFVFALNAVYFPLIEEPDLRSRFGADYDAYAAHTPRWLPRYRRTTPG